MTKNIRISLYILIPIILWMVSGFFVTDKKEPENLKNELLAVGVTKSNAIDYQPTIKLKATSQSEARVNVRAKTSGEVVKIGSTQGQFVEKDSILCSLGVVAVSYTHLTLPTILLV